MNPIRNSSSRVRIFNRSLRTLLSQRAIPARFVAFHHSSTPQCTQIRSQTPCILFNPTKSRRYTTKTTADEIIEEIQEQYATARDEFEIASEETERKTVYAFDDRVAAREELNNLKDMYEQALKGPDGEEVKRRVGQRIRELDNAVEALEKSALED